LWHANGKNRPEKFLGMAGKKMILTTLPGQWTGTFSVLPGARCEWRRARTTWHTTCFVLATLFLPHRHPRIDIARGRPTDEMAKQNTLPPAQSDQCQTKHLRIFRPKPRKMKAMAAILINAKKIVIFLHMICAKSLILMINPGKAKAMIRLLS
jgi:hypothetical protein